MQKVKCLVVEDEPLAAELLEDYVRQIPFLELTATAGDAIQAIDILQRQPIDLIFLDIHLPRIKGIDFIKTLDKPLNIIITSAYQEYALQGFELNVADYLLKPIQFDRFLKAVNRVREQMVSPVREPMPRPTRCRRPAGGSAQAIRAGTSRRVHRTGMTAGRTSKMTAPPVMASAPMKGATDCASPLDRCR
jgi:two-component SAPR family response regulator